MLREQAMKMIQRVAFIGSYLPRQCGIATFTHSLHQAVAATRPDLDTCVIALTERDRSYEYGREVRFQVTDQTIGDYAEAARFLNRNRFDIACLQHEYGIFGGPAGANIVELISRLNMPVVTTLHTVLLRPTLPQRRVMDRIIGVSAKVIVMAEKGRQILRTVHDAPDGKIELIPHGIPDFPFRDADSAKAKFGFGGKPVILTFGLLSPNKNIESVLDAMPSILEACPNATYVVLGATHPHLVRDHGEAYRETLKARVRQLGIDDHVVFVDKFISHSMLLEYISMCDVYVTPYLNEAQMTSGTLAYSFGLGKAVVSTPYWHAKELLGDGRGILVPFGDASAIGKEIAALLTNDVRRRAIGQRAYAESRSMTWPQTAKRYVSTFTACRAPAYGTTPLSSHEPHVGKHTMPEMRLGQFLALCDDTGMLQHSVHCVPDRAHGYCIDDNARALLLSSALANSGEEPLSDKLISRFASFIQHAWNPGARRFRNFMSFDRRWLEDVGSEDSHGRTLWALGECARKDANPSRRRWAAQLFRTALSSVEELSYPRAWSFTLLGLDAYCDAAGDDRIADEMRILLADRLISSLSASQARDWLWFEDVLAYDNARIPQALIQTGIATGRLHYAEAGLRSLGWLVALQTAPSGCFRPVGTDSFGRCRERPAPFDQQPVEAAATISACLAAARADDSAQSWQAEAMRAFAWFIGENDLQTALIDPDTGSCLDGLHPDRPNQNSGAESVLSYLLGLVEMRQLARSTADKTKRVIAPRTASGDRLVSIPLLDSPNPAIASGSGQGGREAVQAGNRAQGLQSY
jgi:glycosyltransferase involved in cell wall biosynthesis